MCPQAQSAAAQAPAGEEAEEENGKKEAGRRKGTTGVASTADQEKLS